MNMVQMDEDFVTIKPVLCMDRIREALADLDAKEPEAARATVLQLIEEFYDDFLLDNQFATQQQLHEIREMIPDRVMTNEVFVEFIYRRMEYCKRFPRGLFLLAIFAKSGGWVPYVELDLTDTKSAAIFDAYRQDPYRVHMVTLKEQDYDKCLFSEMLLVDFFRVTGPWGERIAEEVLTMSERMVLLSKNKEFIRLAFRNGVMHPEREQRYVEYVMEYEADRYMELVPLLMQLGV